jgi:peptidoglycan/LPS O-acetylase OafA/YrhL
MLSSSSSASVTHPVKYRPDVDGLRALAVLPVILFHAGLGCTGGFVGVDIFFVISGFLITSFILKEIHDDDFSLVKFWERRVRRILPALFVVVLATYCRGYNITKESPLGSWARNQMGNVNEHGRF